MRSLVVVCCCWLAASTLPATAQAPAPAAPIANPANTANTERPSYQVPRASSEIKVDGHLDEAAWRDALVFQLGVELKPTPNAPAPVSTTVYLAYDEKHLYA